MNTQDLIKHGLSLAALLGASGIAYAAGDTHSGAFALGALAMYIVPVIAPAVPRAAVAGLVVGAMALGVGGCGASLPAVVSVGEIAVNATCAGAAKLCELNDPSCGSAACRAFHDGCAVLAPTAPVELSCSASPS